MLNEAWALYFKEGGVENMKKAVGLTVRCGGGAARMTSKTLGE